MKLTILADNNTSIDKYYLGEPAFCVYVEAYGQKILFDTGYSDVFLQNAKKAGIDLSQAGYVVLSHGHNDHTGGLKYFKEIVKESKPFLVACPEAFKQRYDCDGEFGCPVSKQEIEKYFTPVYTKEPYFISSNIAFLGRIKRQNDFEAQSPVGFNKETKEPDFVPDDSALAINTQKGIVILTGCSHSGIVNICRYAQEIFQTHKIHSIIGGLHLINAHKRQLELTFNYLESLNLETLYPCHCTGFKTQCMLSSLKPFRECSSGLVINFDFAI